MFGPYNLAFRPEDSNSCLCLFDPNSTCLDVSRDYRYLETIDFLKHGKSPSYISDALAAFNYRKIIGISKTYSTTKQFYYWPNMKKDIEASINSCAACQEQRNSNTHPRLGELTLPSSAKQPMLHIGCDLFFCSRQTLACPHRPLLRLRMDSTATQAARTSSYQTLGRVT